MVGRLNLAVAGGQPPTAGQAPASAKRTEMQHESRLERRIDRALDRATTPRGAAEVIAVVSTVITSWPAF